jgi:hypothetical protein
LTHLRAFGTILLPKTGRRDSPDRLEVPFWRGVAYLDVP